AHLLVSRADIHPHRRENSNLAHPPRRKSEHSARDRFRPAHDRSSANAASSVPRPPLWRDVWAWASVLAIAPLVLHSLGARLGEPVADDFAWLPRAPLTRGISLFE